MLPGVGWGCGAAVVNRKTIRKGRDGGSKTEKLRLKNGNKDKKRKNLNEVSWKIAKSPGHNDVTRAF